MLSVVGSKRDCELHDAKQACSFIPVSLIMNAVYSCSHLTLDLKLHKANLQCNIYMRVKRLAPFHGSFTLMRTPRTDLIHVEFIHLVIIFYIELYPRLIQETVGKIYA